MDYARFGLQPGRLLATLSAILLLAACGGGGGSSDDSGGGGGGGGGGTPPTTSCNLVYKDSFGRVVTCPEMLALPGANYLAADGSGGGDGGAGGDGSGADGAPIANATLHFIDVDGRTVETTTDANGYFRINIGGLKSPIVATVMRDGNAWKSALVELIEKRENFYTINLTGLTDVVLTRVASAAGVSGGADAITPQILAANLDRVSTAVGEVNTEIADTLISAGLDPATFNPFNLPFVPDGTGYDKVLDDLNIAKSNGGSTIPDQNVLDLAGSWSYSGTAPDCTGGVSGTLTVFADTSTISSRCYVGTHFVWTLDTQTEQIVCSVESIDQCNSASGSRFKTVGTSEESTEVSGWLSTYNYLSPTQFEEHAQVTQPGYEFINAHYTYTKD